jgi:hypothetical protein
MVGVFSKLTFFGKLTFWSVDVLEVDHFSLYSLFTVDPLPLQVRLPAAKSLARLQSQFQNARSVENYNTIIIYK